MRVSSRAGRLVFIVSTSLVFPGSVSMLRSAGPPEERAVQAGNSTHGGRRWLQAARVSGRIVTQGPGAPTDFRLR